MQTQNLVLSIWESSVNPRQPGSWKRSLIVNRELERYFAEHLTSEEELHGRDAAEVLRLRRRIRTFSWCPSVHTASSQRSSNFNHDPLWSTHLLAVSNDFNEVIILQVQSPYNTLRLDKAQWSAQVLAHFSVKQDITSFKVNPSSLYEEYMNQQRFVLQLAWSPWIASKDGSISSLLAYGTNDTLSCRNLSLSGVSSSAAVEVSKSDGPIEHKLRAPLEGPLRWSPRSDTPHMFLIAFASDEALCFSIPTKTPRSCSLSTHDLDGRWDPISGKSSTFIADIKPTS